MGFAVQTFTDYAPACGDLALKFMELLSQCVIEYDGHYYLNTIYNTAVCDSITPFITCQNNHLTPDEVLQNIFALDECGNLAVKLFLNLGSAR